MDDLVFKSYKAQIPPKWQQFAEAGSGANCKWARTVVNPSDKSVKYSGKSLTDTSISANAGAAPESNFNPNSRYTQLTSGTDRTLKDHKDIHFARFLYGPEKHVPIEDLIESSSSESSEDEDAVARRGARRKARQTIRRTSTSSKGHPNAPAYVDSDAQHYQPASFGAARKKKTWTDDMKSYLNKAKIRKDAKIRTAKLEEILRQRQRQAADRREREVEKFAGGGGSSSPKKKNFQSMRAEDEVKANWYHALVCAAQELEGDEVRSRLRDQYDERQMKRDDEARSHYEKVLSQSKVATQYKVGQAKANGADHTRQVIEANMRAQAETIKALNHIKDEEKKSDNRRKAHAERKEQQDLATHNESIQRRNDALDRFQNCLEAREANEARQEEQFQMAQATANERLLLRNIQREEAIEEKFYQNCGGGNVKKGESKGEKREAAMKAVSTARLNKISDRQHKADVNYTATMQHRLANAHEHRTQTENDHRANQSRLNDLSNQRAKRSEEIIDKVENIKKFGQRSAPNLDTTASSHGEEGRPGISNAENYALRQMFVKSNRSLPAIHTNNSSSIDPTIAFNHDFNSATSNKLSEHQQRNLEIADDLDSYYVEKSEEMFLKELAFQQKFDETKKAKAAEASEKAALHKAKCDQAYQRKMETEERIAGHILKKDKEVDRRISERNKFIAQKTAEAVAKNAQKTGAALYKVNTENHVQLLQSIEVKQQHHTMRKAEQEALAKVDRDEKDRVKLSRVAAIKQQVEDAAKDREAHYEAIANEKRIRSDIASLARTDGLDDLQQRLAERATAVNRQREAQRKSDEKEFVESTASITKRYAKEKAIVDTVRRMEADRWRAKNAEIAKTTEQHREGMLAQVKERNDHTRKYFTERSTTPQPATSSLPEGYSPSDYAKMPARSNTSQR